MRYLYMFIIVLTAISAISGCLHRADYSLPETHDLGLQPHHLPPDQVNWTIKRVDAPIWLWNDQIRYRLLYANPTRIDSYTLDRWEAPPPEMLKYYLTSAATTQPADYLLSIFLADFEQQFESPRKARVVINMIIEAIPAANDQTVYKRRFYFQKDCTTANASGAIKGFSHLANSASIKIQEWLASLSTHGALHRHKISEHRREVPGK